MMNRQIIDLRAGCPKHRAVPIHTVVADSDQPNRWIDAGHRGSITFVVRRIRIRIAVPTYPVSPDLVANFPVLHLEWLRIAVHRAHRPNARRRRAVCIFDPGHGFVRRGARPFYVDGDRRLRSNSPAKTYEFIRPEIARLQLVPPGKVRPCETLIPRTNTPHPVI